jgi:hypothetical protein
MAVLAAGAIVSGGIALGKAIHGGVQKRKARKALESLQRPEYKQSEQLKENLAQAKKESQQGLPAQQYQAAQQQIDRQYSLGGQQIQSLQGGLAGLGGLAQSSTDAFSKLISADAAARESKRQDLYGARTAMAGEEKTAYEQNVLNPFQEERSALSQDYQIGAQNLSGGLSDLGSAAMDVAGQMGKSGTDASAIDSPENKAKWDALTPEQQEQYAQAARNAAAGGWGINN